MTKVLLSTLTLLLAATLTTSASAHSGMEYSSILHNSVHIITTVGIYLAMMVAGFYLLRKLPKAKRQRVKK